MFPQIIHQIWLQGKDKIPDKYSKMVKSVKETNPTFKHIIWDDTKIKDYFKSKPEILTIYNKFPYLHQKVDFIRYCILYQLGGIYLDMDITVIKSFTSLFDTYKEYECIISTINIDQMDSYIMCQNKQCINNGIIIAKPKSPFIKSVIDEVTMYPDCSWYDLTTSMCVNNTTGPVMFSRMYEKYNLENPNKLKLLDPSYLEPCLLDDMCNIKDNTYTIHHHSVTWMHPLIATTLYYYLQYHTLIRAILLIILIQIIYYIFNYIKQR